MGYTVWHFVVDEATADLKRVPAVRWSALWNGETQMPEWAGREVRAIELALEVHRRRVQRVLRVLAHRMIVRSDGLHDGDRELKRTLEVVSAAHDPIRELDRRLTTERLRRGSGIDRGRDRKTWRADLESLPDGTVIIGADGQARLVLADRMLGFSFGGWTRPEVRTVTDVVEVLTPPTSVRALANGFTPVLHPTAG